MEQVRNFIDLIAQGQNAEAKESLDELLSARAFEALDAKKQEIGATLFGSESTEEANQDETSLEMAEEVEELDELDTSTLKSYANKANKQLKTLNKVVDDNRGKLPKPVKKAISHQQNRREMGIERSNAKVSDRAFGITK
jgi:hypothetical protein